MLESFHDEVSPSPSWHETSGEDWQDFLSKVGCPYDRCKTHLILSIAFNWQVFGWVGKPIKQTKMGMCSFLVQSVVWGGEELVHLGEVAQAMRLGHMLDGSTSPWCVWCQERSSLLCFIWPYVFFCNYLQLAGAHLATSTSRRIELISCTQRKWETPKYVSDSNRSSVTRWFWCQECPTMTHPSTPVAGCWL